MKPFRVILRKFFPRIKKGNDNFLYTKVIYNEKNNFMILISFTEKYFTDAIQFLSAVSYTNLSVKFVQSSYEEKNNDNILIHNRYYILISGNDYDYIDFYETIDSCSNSIALALEKDIINYRNMDTYSNTYFYESGNIVKYDKRIDICSDELIYTIDDIKKIKSNLPECFTGQMLLDFIYLSVGNDYRSLFSLLCDAYNFDDNDCKKIIEKIKKPVLSLICAYPTDAVLKNWCGPQYLVNDDGLIAGDIDNASIDDIFKQDYQKCTAIASDDVEYVDIDEELSREEIYEDESEE